MSFSGFSGSGPYALPASSVGGGSSPFMPGAVSVYGGGGGGGLLGDIASSFVGGLTGGNSNIFRLAGTIGNLLGPGFDIKDSTKALKKQGRKTTKKIDERIENIYPGLTGMTGEEALSKYYDAFADTVDRVSAQGRSDLTMDPDISKQYSQLNTRINDIQNQYSLANKLGGYEKLALDPAVVSMDVGSIRSAADWTAPEIASQYGMFTDYSGPQASKFIYGNRGTADAVGRYYNTSGDVAGLMNYGYVV